MDEEYHLSILPNYDAAVHLGPTEVCARCCHCENPMYRFPHIHSSQWEHH